MMRLVVALALFSLVPQFAWAQCNCGDHCGCGPGCRCGAGGSNGFTNPEYGASLGFKGHGIYLQSRLSLADLGSTGNALGSAIWGWTDRGDSRGPQEYALFGLNDRTAFVNVTNPTAPYLVGSMATSTGSSVWRELKTYQNYAYVVSDGNGNHGMQVLDMTQFRNYNSGSTPGTFTPTTRYYEGNQANAFRNSHTIFVNESSGYAYAFGTNTNSGGVHVVDIRNPTTPAFAGGYAGVGYIHDGQVVNYTGPDSRFTGQEILFAANSRGSGNTNDDAVQIINVSNKSSMSLVGTATHTNARYIHQGWLTPDQRYFIVNDELDEYYDQRNTTTHVYDVSSLTNPFYVGGFVHGNNNKIIDHNLFIKVDPIYGPLAFESNYTTGLRVIQLRNLAAADMQELAWFDTYPADDGEKSFNGQWGNYAYFDSGTIIAGDRQNGLFILRMDLSSVPEPGTWALIGVSVLGGLGYAWNQRRQRHLRRNAVIS
jgi:choice-of-anchor B domain-containing protein